MSKIKSKIETIKSNNPDLSFREIAKLAGCSPTSVRYYLNPKFKKVMTDNVLRWESANPYTVSLKQRRDGFHRSLDRTRTTSKFSIGELKNKLEKSPVCYLSGTPINLLELKSYELDHIIPKSRGGTSELNNLGLTTKRINQMKNDLTVTEFLDLCKKILEYNGYIIS